MLVATRCYRLGLIVSLLALLIAQQTWVLVGTVIDGDEGGVTKYLVTSLGLGFYVWVLSFVLIAAMAARCSIRGNNDAGSA
jgi:hypothetical protein